MKAFIRLSCLFLSLFINPMLGESRSLSGCIVDDQRKVIPYANIAVFNDSTFISAFSADSCGFFSANNTRCPTPRLRVSMIGYETVDTVITDVQKDIVICLKNSAIGLDEVEVSYSAPTIEMKGDILVTNVVGTALQRLGSASDVLRHVPLISADNNDNIEVFGRGTPAVYVNGRKINDMRELRQLRSENIKSIEVITNPGR